MPEAPAVPTFPTLEWGAVAQLGERLDRTQEVRGSSPLSSTALLPLGVTGNTPDSGSGESWFEPRRGNSKPDSAIRAVGLRQVFPGVSVAMYVSDYLCLCSATDPRLGKVADSPADNTARRMLAQYRNWFQKPYSPGCLLVRHDAPGPLIAADALRAFRNVCAISTITHTMALALASSRVVRRTWRTPPNRCRLVGSSNQIRLG